MFVLTLKKLPLKPSFVTDCNTSATSVIELTFFALLSKNAVFSRYNNWSMTGMLTCILYKNSHVKGYSILKYVHLTTFIREKESKGSCAMVQPVCQGVIY